MDLRSLCSSAGRAVSAILSPSCSSKSPVGMMTCSPRWTAQIRKFARKRLRRLCSGMPLRGEPSFSRSSIMMKFRWEKVSIFIAEGYFSALNISCAASFSGLMAMVISSSLRMKARDLLLYSGLRMRAIVWAAPMRLARKQQSMFSSSEPVTAMNSAASETPASSSVSQSAALPQTTMTSNRLVRPGTSVGSLSSAMTSCPSLTRLEMMVVPIFPQPATMIFMENTSCVQNAGWGTDAQYPV